MTRRTPEEVSKMAAMRLPEKSPVPAPPAKKEYPVDTHSHPYAIAEHRIKMLEDANKALRKENADLRKKNLSLRSLAIHGIIYRLESLAGAARSVGQCARLHCEADRWRAMWDKLRKEMKEQQNDS